MRKILKTVLNAVGDVFAIDFMVPAQYQQGDMLLRIDVFSLHRRNLFPNAFNPTHPECSTKHYYLAAKGIKECSTR